ncbi:MAG: PP2C family serine/threonine-protein phosphatase [Ktedonobacteraceae bacterium]
METTNIPQKTLWHILDASAIGTSHQKANRGCEDKYCFDQYEDGTLLIAVADGAGSASCAAEGAQYVVNKALEVIKGSFAQDGEPNNLDEWSNRLRWVLETLHIGLKELAENKVSEHTEKIIEPFVPLPSRKNDNESEEGDTKHILSPLPLREYATTLLLSVITSRWIAIAQIGDGIVVMQDNDGKLQLLTKPDHGEYINETNFITDPNYHKHIQFFIQSDMLMKGIAVLTDGLQMLALDFATSCPHEPFFLPLFEIAATQTASSKQDLENFLASERVCERTDDDKTIVLAVRS